MKKQDYHTSIVVNAPAQDVFKNINSISQWWAEDLEGSSQNPGDVFTVHFGQTFVTLKVTELVPGKKIVWDVTDCYKHWLKDKKEWKDTQIIWEFSAKDKATQVDFTHLGLVPGAECYDVCENAWTDYLHGSLTSLINTGKGKPTPKAAGTKAANK